MPASRIRAVPARSEAWAAGDRRRGMPESEAWDSGSPARSEA